MSNPDALEREITAMLERLRRRTFDTGGIPEQLIAAAKAEAEAVERSLLKLKADLMALKAADPPPRPITPGLRCGACC